MEVFMQPIKRPCLSLLLSFICSILALGGIGGVSLFLPRIMEHYITRFVPGVMDQYALILAILYVALAIALAVVCLLLYLLHIVRTDRVFTLISSRLVLAIACLVITEGLVFGVLGVLYFPLAYAICFVAITMGLCLAVVRTVLKDAAALKEENDGTI
jgi:hypothetical protein